MNDDCVTKSCDHETHSHMTLAFIGENGNNKILNYSTDTFFRIKTLDK